MKTWVIEAKYYNSRNGWEKVTATTACNKREAEAKFRYLWDARQSNVEKVRARKIMLGEDTK